MQMPEYYQKKRSIPRFQQDLDCHQLNEIKQYFRNHSVSALSSEVSWGGLVEDMGWGAKTEFRHTAYEHNLTSIYVYKSKRGQGHMSRFLDSNKDTHFCTAPSCDLERFLASRGVKYVVLQPSPFHEYEMVRNYYGDSVTDRTGIHMINHIDEGLFILNQIGASDMAKRAYIIHPLLQGDADLLAFWESDLPEQIDRRVLALALEYRNIANAHLSHHPAGPDAFLLSPLRDVNDMLVADKVQNRKDFELYHAAAHPRAAPLSYPQHPANRATDGSRL